MVLEHFQISRLDRREEGAGGKLYLCPGSKRGPRVRKAAQEPKEEAPTLSGILHFLILPVPMKGVVKGLHGTRVWELITSWDLRKCLHIHYCTTTDYDNWEQNPVPLFQFHVQCLPLKSVWKRHGKISKSGRV